MYYCVNIIRYYSTTTSLLFTLRGRFTVGYPLPVHFTGTAQYSDAGNLLRGDNLSRRESYSEIVKRASRAATPVCIHFPCLQRQRFIKARTNSSDIAAINKPYSPIPKGIASA